MRAKTRLLALFGIVIVAAGVVALRLAYSRRNADDRLAAVRRQSAALEREARQAQARLAGASDERAALQAERERLGVANKVEPAPAQNRPAPYNSNDALRDNPVLQSMFLRSEQSRLAQQYGLLFQLLGLTPAQREQFAQNVMRRREQTMDLNAVAQKRGPADAKAVAALRKQAEDEYSQSQQALLGEAGLKELLAYERTTQPRDAVSKLAGMLALMNAPLSREQGDQLMELMANSSNAERNNGRIALENADWNGIDAGAERILTPAQLALFRSVDPPGGGGSRWASEVSAALLKAHEAVVPESLRSPAVK